MSENLNSNDPLIAEMIASGLIKPNAAAVVRATDEEIEDLDAALNEIVEPQGAGLIEKVETVAPMGATDEAVDPELAEIEAQIAELEAQEQSEPAVETEIDLDTIETALAAQAAREEVYAGQESTVAMIEAPVAVTAAVSMKAPKTPKTPRTLGAARAARFGSGGAGGYVASVATDPALEAAVDALPKKVKEKAANLVDFLHKGRPLSVFTQVAVNILKEEGKFSNERLVRAFTLEATKRGMSSGYSIGTARSQAGQQVALFGRLGIARLAGNVLVPNEDNAIWKRLAS